jgi:hypothetical protein
MSTRLKQSTSFVSNRRFVWRMRDEAEVDTWWRLGVQKILGEGYEMSKKIRVLQTAVLGSFCNAFYEFLEIHKKRTEFNIEMELNFT